MALIALISKRAPGSTLQLAKLLFFVILPVFVVGPLAGVYIDRWNRKRTMITCDVIRGLLVCSIPFIAFYSKQMLPIYLMVLLVFSTTRFFVTSKLAIIPDIVSTDKLLIANSLMSTTGMIATIIGYSFGGILIALPRIGINGGFYIDGLTFFLSAFTISMMAISNNRPFDIRQGVLTISRNIKETIRKSVFLQIKEGLRHIIADRQVRFVVFVLFLLFSGGGSIYVVIIVFIQQSLGSVTRDLGLMVGFFGLGLFLGALIYGRFGHRISKNKIIFLSLLFGGTSLTMFAILVKMYPQFFIAASLTLLFGVSIAPVIVSSNTLIHEIIPEDMRGRVFSALEFVMHLGFLIFMFITSYIAEFIDRVWILIFFGAVFFIFGLLGIFNAKRSQHYKRAD